LTDKFSLSNKNIETNLKGQSTLFIKMRLFMVSNRNQNFFSHVKLMVSIRMLDLEINYSLRPEIYNQNLPLCHEIVAALYSQIFKIRNRYRYQPKKEKAEPFDPALLG